MMLCTRIVRKWSKKGSLTARSAQLRWIATGAACFDEPPFPVVFERRDPFNTADAPAVPAKILERPAARLRTSHIASSWRLERKNYCSGKRDAPPRRSHGARKLYSQVQTRELLHNRLGQPATPQLRRRKPRSQPPLHLAP